MSIRLEQFFPGNPQELAYTMSSAAGSLQQSAHIFKRRQTDEGVYTILSLEF